MDIEKNNRKKLERILIIGVLAIFVVVSVTYAFFQAQLGDGASADVDLSSNTTDSLKFSVSGPISLNINQFNFGVGAGNLDSNATATATLLAPFLTPQLMKLLGGQYVEVDVVGMMVDITNMIIVPIIAVLAEGVDVLLGETEKPVAPLPPLKPLEYEPFEYETPDKDGFEVKNEGEGIFTVSGGLMEQLGRRVVLDDYESFSFFQKMLRQRGVISALRKAGAKDGDTVLIGDIEFDFVD